MKISPVLHGLGKPGFGNKKVENHSCRKHGRNKSISTALTSRSVIFLLYTILMWEAFRGCRLQNDVIVSPLHHEASSVCHELLQEEKKKSLLLYG